MSVVSPKGITPNPDVFDLLRDHQLLELRYFEQVSQPKRWKQKLTDNAFESERF